MQGPRDTQISRLLDNIFESKWRLARNVKILRLYWSEKHYLKSLFHKNRHSSGGKKSCSKGNFFLPIDYEGNRDGPTLLKWHRPSTNIGQLTQIWLSIRTLKRTGGTSVSRYRGTSQYLSSSAATSSMDRARRQRRNWPETRVFSTK